MAMQKQWKIKKVRQLGTKKKPLQSDHYFAQLQIQGDELVEIWNPFEEMPLALKNKHVPNIQDWDKVVHAQRWHGLSSIPDWENLIESGLAHEVFGIDGYGYGRYAFFNMCMREGLCEGTSIYILFHGWWETIHSQDGTEYDSGTEIDLIQIVRPPDWQQKVIEHCEYVLSHPLCTADSWCSWEVGDSEFAKSHKLCRKHAEWLYEEIEGMAADPLWKRRRNATSVCSNGWIYDHEKSTLLNRVKEAKDERELYQIESDANRLIHSRVREWESWN